jgi:hypothetical protein
VRVRGTDRSRSRPARESEPGYFFEMLSAAGEICETMRATSISYVHSQNSETVIQYVIDIVDNKNIYYYLRNM